MTFEFKIRSDIWVSAEIMRCESQLISAVVLHKGDKDRGLIIVKQYVHGQGAKIYSKSRDMDDKLVWQQPLGEGFMAEAKANNYINRQRGYDEDLWVIEVDDPKDKYKPEN